MLAGVKGLSDHTRGLTLIEVLLSILLLSVIFLAVSSLYVAGQRFYLTASDKVMINYELQYAIQHIYENVITGIGEENNPAIDIEASNLEVSIRHIEQIDPEESPTYGEYGDDPEVGYKIDSSAKALLFDSNGDGTYDESLAPQIDILAVDPVSGDSLSGFSSDGNVLIIRLTGESMIPRAGTKQRLTLYSACYPRLNAFQ